MRFPAFCLAVAFALTLTACGRTVSGTVDDATITTRVKVALLNDEMVRAQQIEVKTFEGVVTLSGTVRSKQEEEKAISLARGIRGVKDVRSTLRIE